MEIQFYPDELNWVNAKMRVSEEHSFMFAFCQACLRADSANYEELRHALYIFSQKYPANAERLKIEREEYRARIEAMSEDEKRKFLVEINSSSEKKAEFLRNYIGQPVTVSFDENAEAKIKTTVQDRRR